MRVIRVESKKLNVTRKDHARIVFVRHLVGLLLLTGRTKFGVSVCGKSGAGFRVCCWKRIVVNGRIETIKRRLAELEGRGEFVSNPEAVLPSPAGVTSSRPAYVIPMDLPGANQPEDQNQALNISAAPAEIDPGSDESESLIDVNKDTHGEEYYGGSSSVAILQRLYARARRQSSSNPRELQPQLPTTGPSIVNLLHNPDFQGTKTGPPDQPVSYLLIEAAFLNVFFDTLHYMHPIIDKTTFLQRCAQPSELNGPLGAVYYACLALSAITTAENDAKLGAYSPIQWANLYVDSAKKGMR